MSRTQHRHPSSGHFYPSWKSPPVETPAGIKDLRYAMLVQHSMQFAAMSLDTTERECTKYVVAHTRAPVPDLYPSLSTQ
jgi:hypothetical protein